MVCAVRPPVPKTNDFSHLVAGIVVVIHTADAWRIGRDNRIAGARAGPLGGAALGPLVPAQDLPGVDAHGPGAAPHPRLFALRLRDVVARPRAALPPRSSLAPGGGRLSP